MRAARRHPFLIILSAAAGGALALVAAAGDWSDPALYAGMVGVIAVVGLIGALLEVRRAGPALFSQADGGHSTGSSSSGSAGANP